MTEELGPIPWLVWLLSKTADKRKVTAVTRQQAMQLGATGFGVGYDKVDAEVVR